MIDAKKLLNNVAAQSEIEKGFDTSSFTKSGLEMLSLPISQIDVYTDKDGSLQPFTINRNKIEQLKKSIEIFGLIQPIVVRKFDDNSYQVISGHHRYIACRELGIQKIKAIIITTDSDDKAFQILTNSNIQRSKLLPSELARIVQRYKEIIRKNHDDKNESIEILSIDEVAEMFGLTKKSIYRYINMLDLILPLQSFVDNGQLQIATIEPIRKSLSEKQQQVLAEYLDFSDTTINAKKIKAIIEMSKENPDFTCDDISDCIESLSEKTEKKTIYDKLRERFSTQLTSCSDEQIENMILKLFQTEFTDESR